MLVDLEDLQFHFNCVIEMYHLSFSTLKLLLSICILYMKENLKCFFNINKSMSMSLSISGTKAFLNHALSDSTSTVAQ